MWQTWVTSSQIHSFYKVNIQLLFLFLRRLNIMSDTLRSSRSRSRTSSSWFHNSRRSCWRPGSRQVGERPSHLHDSRGASPPDWTVVVSRCFGPSGDMKCESHNHLFSEASAYRKMQYLVCVAFVACAPKLQFEGQKTKEMCSRF